MSTHLHLVPRLRKVELYLPFTIRFYDVLIKSMSGFTFNFYSCHGTQFLAQSCPLAIFGFIGPETFTFIAEGHSVPE